MTSPSSPATQQPRPRSRRPCCGCLAVSGGLLAVLLVGCLGGGLLFGRPLLHALGLYGPRAEVLYSGAPDPVATGHLNTILDDAGLDGARAVVIPIQGQDGQIAIFTLDEAAGFRGTGEDGFEAALDSIIQANRDGGYDITQVAVDYRGPDGASIFVVAADAGRLEAYANGEITRRELLRDTDVDLSNLIEMYRLAVEEESP